MNHCVFMGNIGQRPELKTTNSGTSAASFSIAVRREFAKQGEERKTDWIPVVAWKNTAEFICKYFNKGDMIAVEGQMQSRKYTDKNGSEHTVLELIADRVHFCGKKDGGAQTSTNAQQSGNDYIEIPCDDDLPWV